MAALLLVLGIEDLEQGYGFEKARTAPRVIPRSATGSVVS